MSEPVTQVRIADGDLPIHPRLAIAQYTRWATGRSSALGASLAKEAMVAFQTPC